LKTVYSAMFI